MRQRTRKFKILSGRHLFYTCHYLLKVVCTLLQKMLFWIYNSRRKEQELRLPLNTECKDNKKVCYFFLVLFLFCFFKER